MQHHRRNYELLLLAYVRIEVSQPGFMRPSDEHDGRSKEILENLPGKLYVSETDKMNIRIHALIAGLMATGGTELLR